MADAAFQYTHRVTYAECTIGDHIYYSRYLDLMEAARGEFFRHLGVTFHQWQERQVAFPVIEARLLYKAPARYDDLLTISLWPTVAERIRLNFAYRIHNQAGTLILQATTAHICASIPEKALRLPPELVESLTPHLRPEPS